MRRKGRSSAPSPTDLHGTTCLVTGAAGFLGAALCRVLGAAGAETHGVVRAGGEDRPERSPAAAGRLHAADLRSGAAVGELVDRVRPRYVFHAAAHPARRYGGRLAAAVGDDVLALAHLLDALSAAGLERFVHLASSLEYGPCEAPLTEEAALRPASRRGATKAAASMLVLQRAREGFPAAVLRIFHVYGPGESPDRLVPAAIRAALEGSPLPFADTPFERDPVYVEDVVDACLAAAVTPAAAGEAFNVGSGRGVSNRGLVAAVEAAAGRPIELRPGAFRPRATDVGRRVADVGKARRLLGWEPSTDLADGLAAAVAWWRRRLQDGSERDRD